MDGFLRIVLLLAIVPVSALLVKYVLPLITGWVDKRIVRFKLSSSLPPSYYTVFNKLILGSAPEFDRIDHVVVSPYGVFVIKVVQLSGWIEGSQHDDRWTRTRLAVRTGLDNPLLENQAQIAALQNLLGLEPSKFHSLVLVTGNARFGAPMPVNVTQPGGILPFIQVRTDDLLGFDEAARVSGELRSCLQKTRKSAAAAQTAGLKSGLQHVSAVLELYKRH